MSSHRSPAARRAVAVAAALLTAGLLVAVSGPAQAAAGFKLTRVAGPNRYDTAARTAAFFSAEATTSAILASGENFPDALAGSFLAGQLGDGAPILLTMKNDLPKATSDELDRLGVDTVYILGGEAAVAKSIEDDLGEREIVRIAGNDRYETAAEIASTEIEGADGMGRLKGKPTVIVASGQGFPDALAGGPLAYAGGFPVLLTPTADLADAAAEAIDDLGAEHAVIAGGTAAVSAAVARELEGMGLTVERVAGNNRYETAVAMADLALESLSFSRSSIDLASGENFPDALAAGPASGEANRPLVLTAATDLSDATEEFLVDQSDSLTTGRVFGGAAAVADSVVTQAEAAGGTGDVIGAARIVKFSKADNIYWWAQDGSEDMAAVSYADADTFTVNGASATIGGFEANMTIGDVIDGDAINLKTEAEEEEGASEDGSGPVTDGSTHDLVNVLSGSFTSGTVGNVNLGSDHFDFISPLSGEIFRRNVSYAGKTVLVDGGQSSLAGFEADVNEGDRLAIESNGVFSLTNEVAEGVATDVDDLSNNEPPEDRKTVFRIDDALGDDPAEGESQLNPNGNLTDTHYEVNERPGASGQAFGVDGDEVNAETFGNALTNGDFVTYAREDGVETFTLINEPVTPVLGQAADRDRRTNGDQVDPPLGDPTVDDGGRIAIVDNEGTAHTFVYPKAANGSQFEVDGVSASEQEFEDAYSAGDRVSVRPGDAATTTDTIIKLRNGPLSGSLGSINKREAEAPDPDHAGTGNRDPGNSYGVTAANNDGFELSQVVYVGPGTTVHRYSVNGAAIDTVNCWEDYLAGGNSPDARSNPDATIVRTVGADGAIDHALTDPTILGTNSPAVAGCEPAS